MTADSPAGRIRSLAVAAHRGDAEPARLATNDPDPAVRAAALGALDRADALNPSSLRAGFADPAALVRRRACELAATGSGYVADLEGLLRDIDPLVAEAAAWALGERGREVAPSMVRRAKPVRDHP